MQSNAYWFGLPKKMFRGFLAIAIFMAGDGFEGDEAPDPATVRQRLCIAISKGDDHRTMITCRVINVKRDDLALAASISTPPPARAAAPSRR